jgi:hypothetical protein
MRLWRWVFVLLIVAVAAALAWHWLAANPGYVLVRLGQTTLETSVVVALALLVLAWLAVGIVWRLLRWPFRAWGRAVKRRGRERLASGLTAFAEGDYSQAERDLGKAAQHEAFRTPALLVLARAAHERGAEDRATQALGDVGASGERAADALRARFLIENGKPREALDLLKAKGAQDALSLRGRHLLVDTALALGEPQVALDALPPLARSQSLTSDAQAELETRVLAAALVAAPDANALNALWSRATRAQRRRPNLSKPSRGAVRRSARRSRRWTKSNPRNAANGATRLPPPMVNSATRKSPRACATRKAGSRWRRTARRCWSRSAVCRRSRTTSPPRKNRCNARSRWRRPRRHGKRSATCARRRRCNRRCRGVCECAARAARRRPRDRAAAGARRRRYETDRVRGTQRARRAAPAGALIARQRDSDSTESTRPLRRCISRSSRPSPKS